jgi:hypothetical protein
MVKIFTGEILNLSDAIEARRDLWAFCQWCGHARRMESKRLVLLAGYAPLSAVAGRMKCDRCRLFKCRLLPGREWASQ